MSNRRRPERRDAHGAPVRTRNEILVAIGTAVGVVVVTALLLVAFRNRPPEVAAPPVVPSTAAAPATSSTTAAGSTSSTSAASTTSTSSTSATTASSTSSTTKP